MFDSPSCSVGPLHSDLEYTVTSQKEGYVLTAVEGTVGDFKAYALAGVSFEVMCFKGCFIEGNKPHRKCRVSFTHGHTYCRRHRCQIASFLSPWSSTLMVMSLLLPVSYHLQSISANEIVSLGVLDSGTLHRDTDFRMVVCVSAFIFFGRRLSSPD